MSNENSNIRVGSAGAGLFAGDKLIAGEQFDWSKLWESLSYVWPDGQTNTYFFVIANLSTDDIILQRDGQLTTVRARSIDWFSIGNKNTGVIEIQTFNEDENGNGKEKYVLEYYSMMKENESEITANIYNWTVSENGIIFDMTNERYNQFAYICFLFDK